jgi:hypothetical protein
MSKVTEVGIEGHTVTVEVATPMFVIVAGIILLIMYAFLVFIMYAWFSDVASHLVYVESLITEMQKAGVPAPDPTDYI